MQVFAISEQERALSPHTLSKLDKKIRVYVERRSKNRNGQKKTSAVTEKNIKKVTRIRVWKIWNFKYF